MHLIYFQLVLNLDLFLHLRILPDSVLVYFVLPDSVLVLFALAPLSFLVLLPSVLVLPLSVPVLALSVPVLAFLFLYYPLLEVSFDILNIHNYIKLLYHLDLAQVLFCKRRLLLQLYYL